jgi:hypothetical protein
VRLGALEQVIAWIERERIEHRPAREVVHVLGAVHGAGA